MSDYSDALFSDCGTYRYRLCRRWGTGSVATFVMLNPSTADAIVDDRTIGRCISYARSWGLSGLEVVNLYAFRSTDPKGLWAEGVDPVGPENDRHIEVVALEAAWRGAPIVAAWGGSARPDRVRQVLNIPNMDRLTVLSLIKSGEPGHPLYLKGDLTPQPWVHGRLPNTP